ncbi:MAG TPA: hypothetical protein VGI10_29855 [Polyangiaceae bacterium]|jgi:hypothetical protein
MKRALKSLLLTAILACSFGCSSKTGTCQTVRCAPKLSFDLRDPSGARVVDGVVIANSGLDGGTDGVLCAPSDACSYYLVGPRQNIGVYVTGYEPVGVQYTAQYDACGNPLNQTVTIHLVPDGSTTSTTQTWAVNGTCGS